MEIIKSLQILSFLYPFLDHLAFFSFSFEFFGCLDILLFFVDLSAFEHVLHEFAVFYLFILKILSSGLDGFSEKCDITGWAPIERVDSVSSVAKQGFGLVMVAELHQTVQFPSSSLGVFVIKFEYLVEHTDSTRELFEADQALSHVVEAGDLHLKLSHSLTLFRDQHRLVKVVVTLFGQLCRRVQVATARLEIERDQTLRVLVKRLRKLVHLEQFIPYLPLLFDPLDALGEGLSKDLFANFAGHGTHLCSLLLSAGAVLL